jgi:hypothetical protein
MAASWGICACCLEVDETVGQWHCGASSGWFTSMELIEVDNYKELTLKRRLFDSRFRTMSIQCKSEGWLWMTPIQPTMEIWLYDG